MVKAFHEEFCDRTRTGERSKQVICCHWEESFLVFQETHGWLSSLTFIMIERLLDVKEPLKAEEPGDYSVLKPFAQYASLNSGDEYTAMSCVVPSVMELNLHLEDMKKSLKLNTLHHISKLSWKGGSKNVLSLEILIMIQYIWCLPYWILATVFSSIIHSWNPLKHAYYNSWRMLMGVHPAQALYLQQCVLLQMMYNHRKGALLSSFWRESWPKGLRRPQKKTSWQSRATAVSAS